MAEALLGRRGLGDNTLLTDLVTMLRDLVGYLNVPGLAQYGVTEDAIPALAGRSLQAGSMRANPIVLTQAEVEDAIRAAL